MAIAFLRSMLRFFLCVLLCALPMAYAHAAPDMGLKVALTGGVLTCSASLPEPAGMRQALNEGTDISIEWKIGVALKRKYWFDSTVASVLVDRHVVPDLVSRSWKLEDLTSGISRHTYSLDEAIKFLTGLTDFPVMDRTLLSAGRAYIIEVTASEWEGNKQGNLWTSWFGAKNGTATTEFLMK